MVLPLFCIVGLLVLETPSSAVAQTLIDNPSRSVYCDGSEVIFTCETRGSATLEWRGDSFYVGDQIRIPEFRNISFTATSLSNANTIANLTGNTVDSADVRVLISTLRIIAQSAAPSGFVMCAVPGGTGDRFDFQVLGENDVPMAPQLAVTYPFEHIQNMTLCYIASVLRSPTNPAANYTVRVNGSSVPYRNEEIILRDGTLHTALVYNSSCGARNISISDNNICEEGPRTEVTVVDPELFFVLNRTLIGGASNIECSVMAVFVGVATVAFKYLLDLP